VAPPHRAVVAKSSRLSLGLIGTGGVCCYGRFSGVVRFAGNAVEIDDLVGWAEEFAHRW